MSTRTTPKPRRTWQQVRKGLATVTATTRAALVAMVETRGLAPVAQSLGVSGQTLAAAALGAPISRGSLSVIERAIESISAPA